MTESSDIRRNLRAFLTARRTAIKPEYKNLKGFSRDTGITYKTLQRVESETSTHQFSSGTMLELDDAYQLPRGSIERMLAGQAPPGPLEITRMPKRPERHPIENGEPHIKLRGLPTLQQGEELTAWRMEDGRLHFRYVTPSGDEHSGPVSGNIPVEEVVKRVRMIADLTQL